MEKEILICRLFCNSKKRDTILLGLHSGEIVNPKWKMDVTMEFTIDLPSRAR